jgi:hypothetical protein
MSHTNPDVHFETVRIDGQTKFVACDVVGALKNFYITLLEPTQPSGKLDFHMSFNVRDTALFMAVNDGERDIGFTIQVNPAVLQDLGHKLLALSAQTSAN